jgi:alkanesulfonate monooxygenase SsuD/methylene tetrahydromethanopterin reductase-like flavin-dependent oxidoreductase (luciferase family)
LGYDYLTLTDHIVLPNLRVPGYPYSESGEFFGEGPETPPRAAHGRCFHCCQTSRIRLVLAVMVVPHRPAVLAAKMLTTIDALSGGRLVVGIGAGWLEAEFGAVVTTSFAERGHVTDEYLRAFRSLWTEGTPRFEGSWVKAICSISLRRFARDPVAMCLRTSLRSLPRSAPVNSWNRRGPSVWNTPCCDGAAQDCDDDLQCRTCPPPVPSPAGLFSRSPS